MKKTIKITTNKRLIYGIIGVLVFFVSIQLISNAIIWGFMKTMPFDFFVNIEKIEAHNVSIGQSEQTLTIVRTANFDIDATSVKEVYRIDDSIPNQLYTIPVSTLIYEKDGNGKELTFTVTLNRPVEKLADYYTIDKVCLFLPMNVKKCKTLKLDWKSYADQKLQTIEIPVRDVSEIDTITLKEA